MRKEKTYLTEEEFREVVILYQNKEEIKIIAGRFNVHYSTILKGLKRKGIFLPSGRKKRIVLSSLQREEVINLFQSGWSKKKLMKKFTVCYSVICKILDDNNILRIKPQKNKSLKIEKI